MPVRIAVDAMGGDYGAKTVINGIKEFIICNATDDVQFELYGDQRTIYSELKDANFREIVSVFHCDENVDSSMSPMHAVRYCKKSGMCKAIESVAEKRCDAVVSAGNTGAYMALAKTILQTVDGIERPALVNSFPNCTEYGNVILDLGANTECSAEMLFQFAIMGSAVAKAWFKIPNPRVGLLNIGTEQIKGTSVLKKTYNKIAETGCVNFVGYVEGFDLVGDKADVIVTDGFTGNIALKTTEGTVKFIANICKKGVNDSISGKLAYLFGKSVVNKVKAKIDPQTHNGASLVGLNGIAVKSHGSADSIGISSAIKSAVNLVKSDFVQSIKNCMTNAG